MAYARTTYTATDIALGFRSIDTSRTQGTQDVKGLQKFSRQPVPHGEIHGVDAATNPLFSHPLFARARVLAGDGPGTHSVMDATQMQAALVPVFNSPHMQPFLTQVDGGADAGVNVNLAATPGTAEIYSAKKATSTAAVVAFFIKIRPNPNHQDIPIIQTCVPMTTPYVGGQLLTKKGVVKGFTV